MARRRLHGAALAILGLLASAAAAQAPPGQPRPKAARAAAARPDREALQIARDLDELARAVLGEDDVPSIQGEPLPAVLARAGRPPRTVEPPGLTADDLDRMLAGRPAWAGGEPLSDEQFLVRVHIDLAGSRPTAAELEAFARDPDPDKRARVVDELLASPGFARNWARYWRDVVAFRATSENPATVNFPGLEAWLAEQLAANRPWDQVAADLLTANGDTSETGAPALYAAHSTNQRFQPAEFAGEASRIFLGVQIACAQCHDHKTDSWKREQFHEFASFFGGVAAGRKPPGRVVRDQAGVPRYLMEDLADPEKKSVVQPRFFLASADAPPVPAGLSSAQRRALAASYVTGQDNPWFARAFVNRVWYALLGDAFYVPVDDLGPEREGKDLDVLETLAAQWAAGGYDVRWLFRTLAATEAYQRSPGRAASAADTPVAACVARLRADQIYDALESTLDVSLEDLFFPRQRRAELGKGNPLAALVARQRNPRNAFNVAFGVDPSTPSDEVVGTIPQALFLMNAPQLQRAMSARPGTMLARLLADHPDDPSAVDALYLKALARRPNDDERRVALAHVAAAGRRAEAFEDLLWALVNSTEFLSRR
jgi:hypothetical protein